MEKTNLNLKEFSTLLSQFFDNDLNIPEQILQMSGEFVFGSAPFTEGDEYPDLLDTLVYLKDVKERNQIKGLNDLVQYYEAKQRRIDNLFDRFEEAEETYAMKFEAACETFLITKANTPAPDNKVESLYFPTDSENNYIVGFEGISYHASPELERKYLAQIKGNQLPKQQKVSSASSEKIRQVTSN